MTRTREENAADLTQEVEGLRTYEVTLWEKVTYTLEVAAIGEDDAVDAVEEMVAQGKIEGVSQGYSARIVEPRS